MDGWKEAEHLFSIKDSPETIFKLGIRASQHICLKLTLKQILAMAQNALSLCLPLMLAVQAPPPTLRNDHS